MSLKDDKQTLSLKIFPLLRMLNWIRRLLFCQSGTSASTSGHSQCLPTTTSEMWVVPLSESVAVVVFLHTSLTRGAPHHTPGVNIYWDFCLAFWVGTLDAVIIGDCMQRRKRGWQKSEIELVEVIIQEELNGGGVRGYYRLMSFGCFLQSYVLCV